VAEQTATQTRTLASAKEELGQVLMHIRVLFSAYSLIGHTSTHRRVVLVP